MIRNSFADSSGGWSSMEIEIRKYGMNIGTILVGLAFAAIAFFVIRGVKNGSIK